MNHVAKVFMTGRSQAVRLPAAFRFQSSEVSIRRDPITGDVILSEKQGGWGDFFQLLQTNPDDIDFLNSTERLNQTPIRDPFNGWKE